MPNLIGTGNNQVPTNGMLGGLAYQSPDSAVIKNLELTNLSGHSSLIPSNATDVFVYDTSRDSDGGAWRKRTQSTSWYNETLNTAIRGGRREFPAVAVIVTTNSGTNGEVIIYDGDDPDMPMWMKFNVGYNSPNQRMIGVNTLENLTSSMMLNAKLVVGTIDGAAGDGGVYVIDFISDNRLLYQLGGYNGPFIVNQIANRNVSTSSRGNQYGNVTTLVSGYINDIAMTVLPNAPIDSATSLPVPTIAVGTNSGTSVITNTGTVTNITNTIYGSGYWDSPSVFDKKYIVTTASGDYTRVGIADIESVTHKFFVTSSNIPGDYLVNLGYAQHTAPITDGFALGGIYGAGLFRESGLCLVNPNIDTPSTSMHSHITSNYNTGYQVGSIKGAWMNGTSTGISSSVSLVTGDSSTFTSGTGSWSAAYQSTIASVSGRLQITATGTNPYATLAVTVVAGKQYRVDVTTISQNFTTAFQMWLGNVGGLGQSQYGTTDITGASSYSMYFTATNSTLNIQLIGNGSSGQVGTVDNVFVYEVEADRSINYKGLQVFGTPTKTAVATGADLVAYSGFSASNYLFQPVTSALNFGTGDFSVMGWARSDANSASTQGIVFRGIQNSDYGFAIRRTTSSGATYNNSLWVQVSTSTLNDNSTINGIANTTMLSGVWNHICLLRRSGVVYVYFNGSLVYSATNAGTLTPATLSNGTLQFGAPNVTSNEMSIALWRISATAPSADQIRKIYEDEKALFQEGAQATLFGSSSAVTALAYDPTTDLLYAGTSSGRSEFKGLRRVSNTTTAVTTAISASNGLVAEQ